MLRTIRRKLFCRKGHSFPIFPTKSTFASDYFYCTRCNDAVLILDRNIDWNAWSETL